MLNCKFKILSQFLNRVAPAAIGAYPKLVYSFASLAPCIKNPFAVITLSRKIHFGHADLKSCHLKYGTVLPRPRPLTVQTAIENVVLVRAISIGNPFMTRVI